MGIPFLNLVHQHGPIAGDLQNAVRDVFASGVFLGGDQVDAFAEEWAAYCGQKYCVPCASGTDAISLLAMASNIVRPGIPANTTPFTLRGIEKGLDRKRSILFPSEAPALQTHFVDVNDAGWPVTWENNTIPVLLYGRQLLPPAYPPNFIDACQAHGWKPAKNFNVCWSFYPSKNLGSFGDAGAVTTDDWATFLTARRGAELWHSRMSEINAAVLRVKLKHLDLWNAQRHAIAEIYYNELPEQVKPACSPGWPTNHHIFAILTDRRESLITHLKEWGIGTKTHYDQPLANLPGALRWCDTTLSLPCYPGLTPEQVQTVCDTIRSFYQG